MKLIKGENSQNSLRLRISGSLAVLGALGALGLYYSSSMGDPLESKSLTMADFNEQIAPNTAIFYSSEVYQGKSFEIKVDKPTTFMIFDNFDADHGECL